MLGDEVFKYRRLSGDLNDNTPIIAIGKYLDGYERGLKENIRKHELRNNICQIILEGEPTNIGTYITIERIKEELDFNEWCNSAEGESLYWKKN